MVERAGRDDAERDIRPDQVCGYCTHTAVPAGHRKAGCAVCDESATAGSQVVAWLQDVDADLGQDRRDLRAHVGKTMRGHVPGPWIEDEADHGMQPSASRRQPDTGPTRDHGIVPTYLHYTGSTGLSHLKASA